VYLKHLFQVGTNEITTINQATPRDQHDYKADTKPKKLGRRYNRADPVRQVGDPSVNDSQPTQAEERRALK